ncbi:MAG: LytTR family DNA-binding domain-containing protein [Reinekea sp.]|nr:LytTR family DNA-binding domain-containing protein [Reinekea sp.]
MKVLVVDDEPLARDRLIRFLQDIDSVDGIQAASNGEEALTKLTTFPADVVLLDIRMPGKSGLEVAVKIKDRPEPPAIVFCTAYEDYALDAFKVKAQSYLLKPVQRQALVEALDDCSQLTKAQIQGLANHSSVETISVHNGREKELMPLSDIYFFKAEQKYVSLFSVKGERVVDESLKVLEDRYEDCFIRVHRNTLVYKPRIEKLNRDAEGSFWLTIKGVDEPIAVSRRHAKGLKQLFES